MNAPLAAVSIVLLLTLYINKQEANWNIGIYVWRIITEYALFIHQSALQFIYLEHLPSLLRHLGVNSPVIGTCRDIGMFIDYHI